MIKEELVLNDFMRTCSNSLTVSFLSHGHEKLAHVQISKDDADER